jgi:predicted metalloprotease
MGQFVAAVLGDTEDRWREIFEQNGQIYRPPRQSQAPRQGIVSPGAGNG